jgi:hypothetical protein
VPLVCALTWIRVASLSGDRVGMFSHPPLRAFMVLPRWPLVALAGWSLFAASVGIGFAVGLSALFVVRSRTKPAPVTGAPAAAAVGPGTRTP